MALEAFLKYGHLNFDPFIRLSTAFYNCTFSSREKLNCSSTCSPFRFS